MTSQTGGCGRMVFPRGMIKKIERGVAGSAPRGRDPEEDADLARALQESKKEQNEHAVVVQNSIRLMRTTFSGSTGGIRPSRATS